MLLPLVATLIAAIAIQAAPIDVSAKSGGEFAFDWSGGHVDGTPMAKTTHIEFHYMPDPPAPLTDGGDDHITVRLELVAKVGENIIPMLTSLEDVPGGVYNLNVRLIGEGNLPSVYSTPVLALRVRVMNPDPPTNVRVVNN